MPNEVWIGPKPEAPPLLRPTPTLERPTPTLDMSFAELPRRKTTYTGVVKIPNSNDIFLVKVGNDDRPAGPAELEEMEDLLKKAFSKPGGKAIMLLASAKSLSKDREKMKDKITLNTEQLLLAKKITDERIKTHEENKTFDYRKNAQDGLDEYYIEYYGICAEIAFCILIGADINQVGRERNRSEYRNADVVAENGDHYQIRHTQRPNGRLIVRRRDKDGDTFVLITGEGDTFYIVGWIKGVDAKKDEWVKDPNGRNEPVYFVPQQKLKDLGMEILA
jgi:hypothetical protein